MNGLLPRHTAQLEVRMDHVPAFVDALDPFAESLNAFEVSPVSEMWTLHAVLRTGFDRSGIANAVALAAAADGIEEPELTIQPLSDFDWLGQLQRDFPPFRIGRFFLHGSHYKPRSGDGPIRLLVNAGAAFGSGEHATTQGCLLAMEALSKRQRVRTVLDMGCGSGILSLAAAKLWRAQVIAVDIDREAAAVTRVNAKLNRVPYLINAGAGNGYEATILTGADPFDLIVCNLFARPLKRMAPALARHLKPGGAAILSGLLQPQEAGVLAAHRAQGLELAGRQPIGEWRTLILRKR